MLIVSSESTSAEELALGLERRGFTTINSLDGDAAVRLARDVELILLDVGSGEIDGPQVCDRVRAVADTPVIGLTCAGTESYRVRMFRAGADDCLERPFDVRELTARIEAIMRRRTAPARPSVDIPAPRRPSGGASKLLLPLREAIEHGALRVNADTREVELAQRVIDTTRKEFDLLYQLASQPGVVVPREQLMSSVWQGQFPGARASRTLDTHVSSLRGKLGAKSWIVTVRGVGFRIGEG
ncbi:MULTISPECIES: response regulator transcription factor [Actinosynnema]|uniref:response regulator transcription factor n=1 Tax=Actinosynnema TaxID=40566 RepID=UPI0027E2294B|nr:response regulator transcription factor [Actinosynnema pretiosum]MCP2092336.1 DNA-binding response regulator, OmpR family, contains REC and winged-helix (wHTH) domain [Actinosynnema pretiosum]